MELLLRVRDERGGVEDLRVELEPTHTVAELARGLGHPGTELHHVRTGRHLSPETTIAETGLVSGEELQLGRLLAPPPAAPAGRGVSVDVLAGPDSGRTITLQPGRWLLGRMSSCEIVLDDPTVSRQHAHVEVAADWSVTVHPIPGVENPVRVNDVVVEGAANVGPYDVVTLGSSRVRISPFTRPEQEARDRLAQIEFHRTPYRPVVPQERVLDELAPVPTRPDPRPFRLFSILAPLMTGLLLFAFTRQTYFLAIVLMSPLAAIGTWFEDRRSGRTSYEDEVAAFEEALEAKTTEVGEALAAERVERIRSAPDLADLGRRAELRTPDLWPRGREADDFLRLRLGLGSAASLVSVDVATQGEDELRRRALEQLAFHSTLTDVPVTADLAQLGVLGVCGDRARVDELVSSLVLQAATLHSPEDLILVAALGEKRGPAAWCKWLPHAHSSTSPLAGKHLATTTEDGNRLLTRLLEVVDARRGTGSQTVDPRWPWLVIVLDAELDLDAARVAQLLDAAPAQGITAIWLADDGARVVRHAEAIVECDGSSTARLWSTDPAADEQDVELEQVSGTVAERVAMSLAPVRDASVATATTAIPRVAPLLSTLGVDYPTADWVASRWRTERGYTLDHPVGLGADGIFTLDLVEQGPHTLIGGTSGAGKSELLQSMVASLMTLYPPSRLNFLFVDYKGGASSEVFRDSPHTVGYVTNLDALLSLRALTSLRAELDHRMAVLKGRAKDVRDMLQVAPEDAPPSLVIVVDEFATLVKEIPEFVAGMVDIAQRGRSLGIHLVLATQRPSGSVDDNILANTNLRLSLRMLERGESAAIIDSPDAADIPVPLRGRGLARLGPGALVPFQSAYANAPVQIDEGRRPVLTSPFDATGGVPPAAASGGDEGATELEVVLDALAAAKEQLGLPEPRTPWQDVLPEKILLDDIAARTKGRSRDAGRMVLLGMLDEPEKQSQRPLVLDLEESGGLLVFGGGGAGSTTLLRTAAASAARDASADDLVVFGLDLTGRALPSLTALPHVSEVATGDDEEAVTRIITVLERELDRRRALLGEAQTETLTSYRRAGGELPRVLVLVDGFLERTGQSGGTYGETMDTYVERLRRVVLEGRQVGMHTIIAARSRRDLPSALYSAVGRRLVLSQPDVSGYADLGVPMAVANSLDLPPGRGLLDGERTVHVALVSEDDDARSQAAALAALGQELDAAIPPELRADRLPEEVALADLPATTQPRLGVVDISGGLATVDVRFDDVVITGLPRSGRSTAAMVLAEELGRLGHEVWAIGTKRSPLREVADPMCSAFGMGDVVGPLLDELVASIGVVPGQRPFLVVDDLDDLDENALRTQLAAIAANEDVGLVGVVELGNVSGGFTQNPLLERIRRTRRQLFLQPDDPMQFFTATSLRSPARPGTPFPPGRGILHQDRRVQLVQVAAPAGMERPEGEAG